jgi:hypothetical protein
MDRRAAILQLRDMLRNDAAARDWAGLGQAARALGTQLPALAAAGRWNAAERGALAQLRDAHDQAALACADAVRELEQRLDDMRANKEGWIAYALDNETALPGMTDEPDA